MDNPNQDVQGAESSTAVLEVPRDNAAYAHWRQTGELPAPKEKPAAAAGSPEGAQSSNSAPDKGGKSEPASEAGKGAQENKGKRDNAAQRLNEILGDLREAGLTPAELKSFKTTYQRVQQQSAEAPKTTPAEKTGNPAGDGELKPPEKPKSGDFKTWDEYEAARDKYVEDLIEYKDQVRQRERAQQLANASVHEKMMEAKGRYGDEAIDIIRTTAKAFTSDQQIPAAVKSILNDSPVWTDLLYTLGSGAELNDFIQLAKTNPGAAIRKVVVMEGLVQAELAKGGKQDPAGAGEGGKEGAPERDTSGKFKPAPGKKKESDAPPPATEVSGRNTPPPDQVDQAVKNGDTRAYLRLKNEEAMRGRRG